MKNFLFTALLALGIMAVSTTAKAQLSLNNLPPYKLGVTAGLNASNFSHEGFDGKCGFHLGVNALFDASELLDDTYVRAELLFQRKGARVDKDYFQSKIRTCYLELPVRYGYACGLNSDWTIFGETGPYFAIGLGGRIRSEVQDEYDKIWKSSHKFFTGDNDAHLFDMGWGVHVGGIYQQVHQISIGWDWGFINMNDACLQNRNFMVSYTYYFL